MLNRIITLILVSSLLGCSEPTVSKDGSTGTLKFGTQTLGDICVVVHKKEGSAFQQIYLQPEKSPLKSTWTADMTSLDLNAPEELLKNLPK
jgi:hypothetical protein